MSANTIESYVPVTFEDEGYRQALVVMDSEMADRLLDLLDNHGSASGSRAHDRGHAEIDVRIFHTLNACRTALIK